jgi:hypothetical protein
MQVFSSICSQFDKNVNAARGAPFFSSFGGQASYTPACVRSLLSSQHFFNVQFIATVCGSAALLLFYALGWKSVCGNRVSRSIWCMPNAQMQSEWVSAHLPKGHAQLIENLRTRPWLVISLRVPRGLHCGTRGRPPSVRISSHHYMHTCWFSIWSVLCERERLWTCKMELESCRCSIGENFFTFLPMCCLPFVNSAHIAFLIQLCAK